ncbi:hypothetical protein EAI_07651 [Harpegnathos saltator]|uniref:Uncharacterized protein n=1 Tax=Harpegnathos saltator TaxID=610380 RepID=E2B4Q0_HARSA|nr:hypothetical protein EAI_07651 [Harpegnathos saltator]
MACPIWWTRKSRNQAAFVKPAGHPREAQGCLDKDALKRDTLLLPHEPYGILRNKALIRLCSEVTGFKVYHNITVLIKSQRIQSSQTDDCIFTYNYKLVDLDAARLRGTLQRADEMLYKVTVACPIMLCIVRDLHLDNNV